MSMKSDYMNLATMGMMMAAAAQNPDYVRDFEAEKEHRKKFVCGNCKHCPQYPKTYCKIGKKQAVPTTVCINCKSFEMK